MLLFFEMSSPSGCELCRVWILRDPYAVGALLLEETTLGAALNYTMRARDQKSYCW